MPSNTNKKEESVVVSQENANDDVGPLPPVSTSPENEKPPEKETNSIKLM